MLAELSELAEQSGVWMVIALAVVVVGTVRAASRVLSHRRALALVEEATSVTPSAATHAEPPSESAAPRVAVSFPLLALPFLLIEAALLFYFPFAANISEGGMVGALLLLVPLLLFLAVARRRGALEW